MHEKTDYILRVNQPSEQGPSSVMKYLLERSDTQSVSSWFYKETEIKI